MKLTPDDCPYCQEIDTYQKLAFTPQETYVKAWAGLALIHIADLIGNKIIDNPGNSSNGYNLVILVYNHSSAGVRLLAEYIADKPAKEKVH